jgi:hypothetical protein
MRVLMVRLVVLSTVLAFAGGVTTASARAPAAKVTVGPTDPLVTPVLDPSRGVSVTVGPGGGRLQTTADNGATLELNIPPEALAGDEQVTMTPIQSLARSGVRFVAGVQLAPSGLELLKPAELDVRPARRVSRAGQIAFGYEGSGSEFGLIPLPTNGRIPVVTLGGVGLASATRGQIFHRSRTVPNDPGAAWLQELAVPLHQLRNHRSVPSNRRLVRGLLAAFYTAYVRPLLRSPGSSYPAWSQAAARGLAWSDEVHALGYARRFPGYIRKLSRSVFHVALSKQWAMITAGCATKRTLGSLQDALVLARTAQALGTAATVGGSPAIAAGLQNCGALNLRAALNPTTVNWQAGLGSDRISQARVVAQIASTRLALQQSLGTNQFTFASAPAAVTETISSWTQAPVYAGQGCTTPSFVGFTSAPAQMYGAFAATLTVPADVFAGAPAPPATVAVRVIGADLANWNTTCPPGNTISFSQSPGAMSGLTAVTALTPVMIDSTAGTNAKKFQGSADILAGGTITGFANGDGKITVTVAH